MPKYKTHISDRDSGKTLQNFIITTYQLPNSNKWKADTEKDISWPEPKVTSTMVGGFETESQALEFAVSEIRRINEISNNYNRHDVNDVYHKPILIDESNDVEDEMQ